MLHAGTETIETERLVLRRLMPEDAPDMFKNWASDPAVTPGLRWSPTRMSLKPMPPHPPGQGSTKTPAISRGPTRNRPTGQ